MQDTNEPSQDGGEKRSDAAGIAQELGHKAAEQARIVAEKGKAKLADKAGGVADALRHASDGLRSDEQEELARYTGTIADKIEWVAGAIKRRDVAGIMSDVTRFAKRQPALFLGGAFTAGLFAARFLKSSSSSGDGERSPSDDGGMMGNSRSSFDSSYGVGAPPRAGMGSQLDDESTLDEVTAPNGFGPAPGGYGPASAPAGAHGGAGTFGAESAGGGPGNLVGAEEEERGRP
jgi:hypothetical protein